MSGYYGRVTVGNTGKTNQLRRPRMNRTSQTFTFRVYSDTDALILETLMGMTDGERSEFIRDALREKITGQLVAAPAPESSPFEQIVMRQLADIQKRLAQGVQMVAPSAAPIEPDSGPVLDDEQIARRNRKLAKQDW